MESKQDGKAITLYCKGQVDSTNASEFERDILSTIGNQAPEKLILDFEDLTYISSAGLRVLLKLKKSHSRLEIKNVSDEVYEILSMTGFDKILKIHRVPKEISIEGKKIIGEGRTGIVYRLDKDMIVKVYKRAVSIEDIEQELSPSREAFILGIPTAISFDIVKVGEHLGARYEMLECKTLAEVIAEDKGNLDRYLDEYASLLRKINTTSSDAIHLPERKDKWDETVSLCLDELSEEEGKKLQHMFASLPNPKTFVHGDCHVKNVMSNGNELFLIDMGGLATGNSLFELAPLYRTLYGFDFVDPGNAERFLELDRETLDAIFDGTMRRYLSHYDESVRDKIALAGTAYLLSWSKRYENNPERVKDAARRLSALLSRVDDLLLPLRD